MPDPRAEDLFGLNDHGDGSDNDAANISADEQQESRTTGPSRSAKRRKAEHPSDVGDDDGDDDDDISGSEASGDGDDEDDTSSKKPSKKPTTPSDPTLLTHPSHLQPLTPAQLASSRLATKSSGVIYLSRIPPFMRPQKVKSLLSRFGPINRIFLSPESPLSRTKRIKFGGNKKTLYEEGWVEFTSKTTAKLVAETLNATIVGGKKGSYYHDDVWNLKYLPKFKWHHLTAQIAHENAARQSRLRAEIAQAQRENKTFTRNVERAKMIENMQESRKRKAPAAAPSEDGKTKEDAGAALGEPAVEVRRQFRQNKIKGIKAAREEGMKSSEGVKKAMGKLF